MLPVSSNGKVALVIQTPKNAAGNRYLRHIWLDAKDFHEQTPAFYSALDLCYAENERGADIFYSTGSFAGELAEYAGRKSTNVVAQRSVFIDIDCVKHGISVGTGFDAMFDWLNEFPNVLVPSLLVNSGGGLHAYFICDQDIPLDRWHAIADRLRNGAAAVFHEACDVQCSTDKARILRVPGYRNWKYEDAAVETLWPFGDHEQPLYTVEQLEEMVAPWPRTAAALGTSTHTLFPGLTPSTAAASGSAFTDAVKETPASWSRMADAARSGEGCEVLARAMADNAGVGYDAWCGLLTVIACTDGIEEGIHAISADHPDWGDAQNVETALAKARSFGGPRKCASFDSPACRTCKHSGRITSPVEIGRPHVRLASATVEVVVAATPTKAAEVLTLPEPPRGYTYKGKRGPGTYIIDSGSDNDGVKKEPRMLWDKPLYVAKGYVGTDTGEGKGRIAWPGVSATGGIPFAGAVYSVPDTQKLVAALSNAGVHHAIDSLLAGEMIMLTRFLTSLTEHRGGDRVGIADNFGPESLTDLNSFTLGTTRYRAGGMSEPVQLSSKFARAADMVSGMVPALPDNTDTVRQEWVQWLRVIHAAPVGAPAKDTRAIDRMFCAMGFGAILPQYLQVSTERGMLVSLSSDGGSLGKTSAVRTALSIYTHSVQALTVTNAAAAGPLAFRQAAAGLPVLLDDFLNGAVGPDLVKLVSDMAYGATSGGARTRATEGPSGFTSSWSFLVGNKDVVSQLSGANSSAEGALRRMFNVQATPRPVTQAEADQFESFERWRETHGGVIGHLWVRHVLDHQAELNARYAFWRDEMRRACPAASEGKYKFVLGMAICTLVATEAAGALGLHPYTTADIMATLAMYITRSWDAMNTAVVQDDDVLEALLMRAAAHTITANANGNTNFSSDRLPVGNALVSVRRYPDTHEVAVSQTGLKQLCNQASISLSRAVADIQIRGGALKRVDLGAGTSMEGIWAMSWVVRLSVPSIHPSKERS